MLRVGFEPVFELAFFTPRNRSLTISSTVFHTLENFSYLYSRSNMNVTSACSKKVTVLFSDTFTRVTIFVTIYCYKKVT